MLWFDSFIIRFFHGCCSSPLNSQGNERCLQIMLDMIHKRECKYVAVLFFASWCPFSRSFRPTFSIISSLYSSIPHFAIEESSVGSSVLSKYGVHGFPTLFIMNSTMRVRYQGPSRSLSSLVAFYRDVTGEGFKFKPMELSSIEKLDEASVEENRLVNLLRQETCLALATVFVLLRLLHSVFPTRLFAQNMSLDSLLEHTVVYLSRVVQLCIRLKEPRKRRNLQEGAMNAGAWASKSLATVSIGDSSSSSR
ncbi:PREDICTED: 5'-adenylylsulfate reductase-like 4 isoform X2 [Tarenaya hassleriana]|uniref:5'-adenylylsulfate reductase-like 4 isoform X2 n=1 Tax=Tarenaya hassleriana TaxID=28532 RepID=UPI00053C8290|nr:PREDICTED: 5'-adenylylsulfate reductase-like 4 isoform X2 [Tarenaya hassleriana]